MLRDIERELLFRSALISVLISGAEFYNTQIDAMPLNLAYMPYFLLL